MDGVVASDDDTTNDNGNNAAAAAPAVGGDPVIPDFKDKTRYAPYVSFRSQISHIATNKG